MSLRCGTESMSHGIKFRAAGSKIKRSRIGCGAKRFGAKSDVELKQEPRSGKQNEKEQNRMWSRIGCDTKSLGTKQSGGKLIRLT